MAAQTERKPRRSLIRKPPKSANPLPEEFNSAYNLERRSRGLGPEVFFGQDGTVRGEPPAILRIRAKIDIGDGNSLSVQGSWNNWEKPTHMACILPDLWEAIIHVDKGLYEFKVLLNGTVWEEGINHAGFQDSTVEFKPRFP